MEHSLPWSEGLCMTPPDERLGIFLMAALSLVGALGQPAPNGILVLPCTASLTWAADCAAVCQFPYQEVTRVEPTLWGHQDLSCEYTCQSLCQACGKAGHQSLLSKWVNLLLSFPCGFYAGRLAQAEDPVCMWLNATLLSANTTSLDP
jgi:hypothetical protein